MTIFKQFFNTFAIRKMAVVFFIVSGIALWGLTGCGDDADSYEAKMYDAISALDAEDWATARAILESLPENSETLKYLSNTYAGAVGLNTFDLLTTLDEIENDASSGTGSIDMIGKLIGTSSGELTCLEATTKLQEIYEAVYYLEVVGSSWGLTDDQKVELGLAGVTRTVLIIAKLICEETGGTSVTMTEEGLRALSIEINQATWDATPVVGTSYSDMLTDDINNVEDAVLVLSDSNDIKDDFDEFRAELDNGQGSGTANDGIIDLDELNYYLANI